MHGKYRRDTLINKKIGPKVSKYYNENKKQEERSYKNEQKIQKEDNVRVYTLATHFMLDVSSCKIKAGKSHLQQY